jgi:hypothetical protein
MSGMERARASVPDIRACRCQQIPVRHHLAHLLSVSFGLQIAFHPALPRVLCLLHDLALGVRVHLLHHLLLSFSSFCHVHHGQSQMVATSPNLI